MKDFRLTAWFTVSCALTVISLQTHEGNAADPPHLAIRSLSGTRFSISWTNADGSFVAERSASLAPPVTWTTIPEAPAQTGHVWSLTLTSTDQQQYVRLRSRSPAPAARIVETSPRPGEAGVAVTRETVLRLSDPLAGDATVESGQFYAEAAGRRPLSRVHLSSDRTAITLFYLEELPGNTRVTVTFNGDDVWDGLGRGGMLTTTGAPGAFFNSNTRP